MTHAIQPSSKNNVVIPLAPSNGVQSGGASNDSDIGKPLRILIVSPIRLLRDGLTLILGTLPRVADVKSAASAESALLEIRHFSPTVILLDLSAEETLEMAHRLLASASALPMFGFAASQNDQDILNYAEAGIAGYIARDATTEELFDAIDRTAKGELLCSPRAAGVMFRRLAALASANSTIANGVTLTDREREIVECIKEGLSNKQIARKLLIGISTVKNHVHHILEKLQVRRRDEAAACIRGWDGTDGSPRFKI